MRAAWARRRALHVRARADSDTPAFGLPEPCFDDQGIIEAGLSALLQDIILFGQLPPTRRRADVLEKAVQMGHPLLILAVVGRLQLVELDGESDFAHFFHGAPVFAE